MYDIDKQVYCVFVFLYTKSDSMQYVNVEELYKKANMLIFLLNKGLIISFCACMKPGSAQIIVFKCNLVKAQ